jgi:hypothetical protein
MPGLDPAISIKYLIAGYAIFFVVLALYLASLFVRWSNLKRNLKSLEEMKKKE